MNMDTLETFLLLSELKNYTQTANRLFLAQSTVTNRIQELEAELEVPLFIRNKKQLQLTGEGELFLPYAKRILHLKNIARKELKHFSHFEETIRIGSTNTIYDCHLASSLISFYEQHASIQIHITIGHSGPLIQMLQDGVLDLAFTYLPYTKKNTSCISFVSDELLLVTSSRHRRYKKGIRKEELSEIPYLYCDFPFQELGSYIRQLFPAGYQFPLEIDRSADLLPFLVTGFGYSFLPSSLVKDSLEKEELISIPLIDFSLPFIHCYMLAKPETLEREGIKKFLSHLS